MPRHRSPAPVRFLLVALLGGLGALAVSPSALAPRAASAEEPPAPSLTRVRHDAPATYARLDAKLGDVKALTGLAAQLKQKDPAGTMRSVWLWARRNLRPQETANPTWRTVSAMIQKGTRTGDAEGALAIGTLLRAAGIPVVWVKTVDVAWLRAGADVTSIQGRVFLEVHVGNQWQLLDPVTLRLYDRYNPKSQMLPGDRLAFDKGGDPHALVLPNRAALYAAQVKATVAKFDVRRLPWGSSKDLLAPIKVFIAGDRQVSRYVQVTCQAMGFLVESSFTAARYAQHAAQIRGRILVVTARKGVPALPAEVRPRLLPKGFEAAAGGAGLPKGYLLHRLPDGTTVIFIAAESYTDVEVAMAKALSELQ